jgi:peptidoglycan hydrolase CwlO-like protein
VGEAVDQRLDMLHWRVQALTEVVSQQNELSETVQNQCRELRESDERQSVELDSLRLVMGEFHPRVDAVGERLDRQADALRSIYATYSQRESELEQVVEGLVRLRSHSVCAPASGL